MELREPEKNGDRKIYTAKAKSVVNKIRSKPFKLGRENATIDSFKKGAFDWMWQGNLETEWCLSHGMVNKRRKNYVRIYISCTMYMCVCGVWVSIYVVRLSLQSEQDIKSLKCGLFAVYKLKPLQSGKKEHHFFSIHIQTNGIVTNTTSFSPISTHSYIWINEFEVRRPSSHTHTQSPPKKSQDPSKTEERNEKKTYVLKDWTHASGFVL